MCLGQQKCLAAGPCGRACLRPAGSGCRLFSSVCDSVSVSAQGYGFPVNQLFDLLLEIQDQYSETLLKTWAGAFR